MYLKILRIILLIALIVSAFAACDKNSEPTSSAAVPLLITTAVSGITTYSAASGGTITSDGGAEVTSRGVCWSINANPTLDDNYTTDGIGSGFFTSTITGLLENTAYHVRAYATNNEGTGYGNDVSFTTLTSSANNELEYLGQTPPGTQFVRFAPNIITDEMIHSITVSPDGQEIYWAERGGIKFTKIENGQWTTPDYVSFSGGHTDFYDDAPVVSPDNAKLFFNSQRPNPYNVITGFGFWFCERTESGWSDPQPLPEVISSTGGIHWQVSISNSGTIYFGIFSDTGIGIYYSRLINGVYTAPLSLDVVNNMGDVIAPFIAPDESYIIFNTVVNGMSGGYYISFKGNNEEWLTPQRLTQFPENETSFVTRDGRYIFCKSYWATAQIIENLRP